MLKNLRPNLRCDSHAMVVAGTNTKQLPDTQASFVVVVCVRARLFTCRKVKTVETVAFIAEQVTTSQDFTQNEVL